MELRARIPSPLRRAVMLTALVALAAPATAGAAPHAHAAKKKKVKAPVVTKVSPMDVAVGETLTIRGKNFKRGRYKNTVVFKRDGARAVFAKAEIATKKLMRAQGPGVAAGVLRPQRRQPGPDPLPAPDPREEVRQEVHRRQALPDRQRAAPAARGHAAESLPDGDCDGDGAKNKVDGDDDNDGLTDAVELSLGLNPCVADSDGDGVLDKYEFDCDRDGVLNRDESDDDNDLLSDTLETAIGTNPCSADSDGDGVHRRLRVPVGRRPQRRRVPAPEHGRCPTPASGPTRTRSSRTPASTTTATR